MMIFRRPHARLRNCLFWKPCTCSLYVPVAALAALACAVATGVAFTGTFHPTADRRAARLVQPDVQGTSNRHRDANSNVVRCAAPVVVAEVVAAAEVVTPSFVLTRLALQWPSLLIGAATGAFSVLLVQALFRRRAEKANRISGMHERLSRSVFPQNFAQDAPQGSPTTAPIADVPSLVGVASSSSKSASSGSGWRDSAVGWLKGDKKPKVPTLHDLLKDDETQEKKMKLMAAVASLLCLDTPTGLFDGVPQIKIMPPMVPMATRTMLLHAAVKGEADAHPPREVAFTITAVAKSMIMEMMDRVLQIDSKDRKARIAALDEVVLFRQSAEQLCAEMAPDVEGALISYEGFMGHSRREELYNMFLDKLVSDANGPMDMLSGLFNNNGAAPDDLFAGLLGGDMSGSSMMKMEADIKRREENAQMQEKQAKVLASVLNFSDDKADKMLERRRKEVENEMTKQMFKSLKGLM